MEFYYTVRPNQPNVFARRTRNFSDLVQNGTFSNLVLNRGGVGKIGDFQPISRRISETVIDRAKVTIDH